MNEVTQRQPSFKEIIDFSPVVDLESEALSDNVFKEDETLAKREM